MLAGDERLCERRGHLGRFSERPVDGELRLVPLLRQLLRIDTKQLLERAVVSVASGGDPKQSVVPMFILMGAAAANSGLSSELFDIAKALARPGARGTLAAATVGACGLFGAICGSSVATAATMGRIAVPEMRSAGYSAELATGSVAAGGTLGILIPPSVILVIYALLAEESVPVLFAAAMLPGILLTIMCIGVVKLYVWVRPLAGPPVNIVYAPGERLRIVLRAWKVFAIFLLSIGGLYAGWFSPTEAAAIGAGSTIVVGMLDRRLGTKEIVAAIQETTVVTASLFFIFLG
ncbi:MAG: TRAP transporter large permease subunit, partial [Acidobacteria bacterium]|nr:TRAP transporter large permease subunit [Acidobacteriota bacterium]